LFIWVEYSVILILVYVQVGQQNVVVEYIYTISLVGAASTSRNTKPASSNKTTQKLILFRTGTFKGSGVVDFNKKKPTPTCPRTFHR
jgi:hypothetical protein